MAFDFRTELYKIERVLRVSTRPREREFYHMSQVVAIGIIVMGVIGLVISMLLHLI